MGWFTRAVEAAKKNDPAARSTLEVVLTYPGFHALFWHRVSHYLYEHRLYLLAKINAQFWRFITGIEIHPGAKLDEVCLLTTGMGIVIGETAEVADDVVLFHGVTLGGTGKETGKRHQPSNKVRCFLRMRRYWGRSLSVRMPKSAQEQSF